MIARLLLDGNASAKGASLPVPSNGTRQTNFIFNNPFKEVSGKKTQQG
jgi:hypothetical protein